MAITELKQQDPLEWYKRALSCLINSLIEKDFKIYLLLQANNAVSITDTVLLRRIIDSLINFGEISIETLKLLIDVLEQIENIEKTYHAYTESPTALSQTIILQSIDTLFKGIEASINKYSSQIKNFTTTFFNIATSETAKWLNEATKCYNKIPNLMHTTPQLKWIDTAKELLYRNVFPYVNNTERELSLERFKHFKETQPSAVSKFKKAVEDAIQFTKKILNIIKEIEKLIIS